MAILIFRSGLNIRKKNSKIEITDITGKKTYRSQVTKKNKKTTFDISNQPTGVYLIKIQTESGIVIKKIIKN